MSIFIAPDAEGTLNVWADVPGKDPVALITAADLTRAGVPVSHGSDTARAAAYDGVAELWQLILDNVPHPNQMVLVKASDIRMSTARWSYFGASAVRQTDDAGWYVLEGLNPDDFTLIP